VRRRRAIIVLAVCVLVGIGVVAFWPGVRVPKEPEYHGKKLREWLRVVEKNSIADHEEINNSTNLDNITNESPQVIEAVRAVRAIGTNALPYLIKWNIEQPRWRQNLANTYHSKCPKSLYSNAVAHWIYGEEPNISGLSIVGFQIMGPDEVYAVPELVRLLRESDSNVTRLRVLACLQPFKARARLALPTLREISAREHRNRMVIDVMNEIQPGAGDEVWTNR